MILLQTTIPKDPTLTWALIAAVGGLVTAVIYLYKQSEKWRAETDKMRDKHEERLLIHSKEISALLEKTIIAFNEVEKKIYEAEEGGNKVLKDVILESQDRIIIEMKSIVGKFNPKL